jgi:hypothetical protein
MYRNKFMTERLESLDKSAPEAPKRSLEEAMRGYEEHEKSAAQAGRKGSILRKPDTVEEE